LLLLLGVGFGLFAIVALQASISEKKILDEVADCLGCTDHDSPVGPPDAAKSAIVASVNGMRTDIETLDGPARRLFPETGYSFSGANQFQGAMFRFGSPFALKNSTHAWRPSQAEPRLFSFGAPRSSAQPVLQDESKDVDQEVVWENNSSKSKTKLNKFIVGFWEFIYIQNINS